MVPVTPVRTKAVEDDGHDLWKSSGPEASTARPRNPIPINGFAILSLSLLVAAIFGRVQGGDLEVMIWVCIFMALIGFVIWRGFNEWVKQRRAALQEYQTSLERLKSAPNNPTLRQECLRLGRHYSNLTRDRKGLTIYDEVAIKNDIDAACAGAVSVQDRPAAERLADLQQLLYLGHISEDEFRFRRQSILKEV